MSNAIYETAKTITAEKLSDYKHIAEEIYFWHEPGMEEFKTSELLKQELLKKGFRIIKESKSLPTAFLAEYGSGRPRIGLLAEGDALLLDNEYGHACGHHLIAVEMLGTACNLASLLETYHLSGTIQFFFCPAEETVGGKVNMVKEGFFGDTDVCCQIHPCGGLISRLAVPTLAIDSIRFEYYGVSAHAAKNPQDGVNALDATVLLYTAVSALRQQVSSDARIHGVIKYGGDVPNTIPDYTLSEWMVRSPKRSELNLLTEKIKNCASGAAVMTGCKLETDDKYENPYDELHLQPYLIELLAESLSKAGVDNIDTKAASPDSSTDVGNVSAVCPTVMGWLALGNKDGADIHSVGFLNHTKSDLAYDFLRKAILGQTFWALDIILNPDVQAHIYNLKEKL